MTEGRTHLQKTADFLFSLGFEEQKPRTFVRVNVKNGKRFCVEKVVLDDDGNVIEGRLPIYRQFTRSWAEGKRRFREPSLMERFEMYGEMEIPNRR